MTYASNIQIVFGPTDDSYLIVHGRRCSAQNMPQDLVDVLISRPELTPFLRVAWIRMHLDMKQWAVQDSVTGTVYDEQTFKEPQIPSISDPERLKMQYWAGDVDGVGYFAATGNRWQIYTDPQDTPIAKSQKNEVARLRQIRPDFDVHLRRIIFGKAARIYVFDDCFHAEFRDNLYTSGHPLVQVLRDHSGPGWTIDESSSLSLYNHEYFVLKFKRTDAREFIPAARIHIRLHTNIMTQLNAMVDLAETEEERIAMENEMDVYKEMVLGPTSTSSIQLAGDQARQNATWNAFQHMRANNAASHELRLANMYNNSGFDYKIGNTTYSGSGINY